MNVLLTGGAGYIGTHVAIELVENGHSVVIIDNLSNSSLEAVTRVEKITNSKVAFYEKDVRNKKALDAIFAKNNIDAVIHLAGLKAVGESVEKPLEYYDNNVNSSLVLLEVMKKHDIKQLVFSSSATVYGEPKSLPLTEESSVGNGIQNPYGWTKFMIEQMLKDANVADPDMNITILRYFNPIGAHHSGLIGEDPKDIPNNLLPYITQVAVGKLEQLSIFGDDYETPDGTGVRDYIHVVDLAKGHVAALSQQKPGTKIYNLGTGTGVSVLELLNTFCKASGKDVPYCVQDRRQGDVAACYADPAKAREELNWKTEKTLQEAMEDSWRWQSSNPDGYQLATLDELY